MEFCIFLGLVILIILNISRSSKNNPTMGALIEAIGRLVQDVRELKKEIAELKIQISEGIKQERVDIPDLSGLVPEREPVRREVKTPVDLPKPQAQIVKPVVEISKEEVVKDTQPEEVPLSTPGPVTAFTATEPVIPEPVASFTKPAAREDQNRAYGHQESSFDKWSSKNPDIEKFIGENLINKIGIAILVLGIAFFVKYAIDQNWINETGRVCIGMGCGAILVGLAHYLRNSYRSFSSVLAGGGIAVFYFTVAFAYHQYHLLSQGASFVMMVVITAFAITLSVLYNKLELAVIAAIGGFIAPFLVTNGEGNYVALFTYLIILNIGLLALAYFKRWPAINVISLFFTEVIFGGWLGDAIMENKPISYPTALLFATAFYLIFLGMNMINQVKNKDKFSAFDFFILLFISCSYYAASMVLLHYWNGVAYQGLFTLSIGVLNLALAYYMFKRGNADKNLLFLLIGLTLSFITLTIPIQLHGHAITMFWSAEFVLLYWLSEYSGIWIFKYSSILICALSLGSLVIDWNKAGPSSGGMILLIFNGVRGIVTNLVAVGSFGAYYLLLRRSSNESFLPEISTAAMRRLMLSAAVALLYITCIFGVNLYFQHQATYDIPNVYHRMVTEIFGLVLIILAQRKGNTVSSWLQLLPIIVCFILYLVSTDHINNLRDEVLTGKYNWDHLYAHWADSLMLALLFFKTIQGIRENARDFKDSLKPLSVLATIMIIVFLSIELLDLYIIAGYSNGNTAALRDQFGKAGLTVTWAICSFILMWLGMKHRQKILRIISLILFAIILFKLFIIDISGISEGGKILAFILLGVLLLTVSFMYQKLKEIIIDDKKD